MVQVTITPFNHLAIKSSLSKSQTLFFCSAQSHIKTNVDLLILFTTFIYNTLITILYLQYKLFNSLDRQS